jgi:hypothetical protein
MEGWIKLHRKIIEHWIFSNPHYFRAWVIMLFTVNYEPKKVLISGHLIDCDRGQSLLSLESWVDLFGVSKKNGAWTFQKVRTFFDLLEQDGMITKENMIKTTRVTAGYLKQPQGVNCTGGVCRVEPAFSGARVTLTTNF